MTYNNYLIAPVCLGVRSIPELFTILSPNGFVVNSFLSRIKIFPMENKQKSVSTKKALVWHVGAAQGLFGLFSVACNYVTL